MSWWHDLLESALKVSRAFFIVNAKIASGFLKPLVLIFFTWLFLFFFCADFFHTASQWSAYL